MRTAETKTNIIIAATFLLLVGVFGWISWQQQKQYQSLTLKVDDLQTTLASTTLLLRSEIATNTSSLADALTQEQQRVNTTIGNVQNAVGSITGTVDTLQKLSKTDPQLLQKYSKVFFLNEHYAPERLAQVPSTYVYSNTRSESIHALVLPHLLDMMNAASGSAAVLFVKSAYRSFDEQKALKNEFSVTYGAGTANSFSADQGYSEHQLGTAVDFVASGQSGVLSGFEKTSAYKWMNNYAYNFGFVLSYPQNNGYYVFEPWHWRYVGIKLATYLHNTNRHFYDLDQREIDTYLVNIFE